MFFCSWYWIFTEQFWVVVLFIAFALFLSDNLTFRPHKTWYLSWVAFLQMVMFIWCVRIFFFTDAGICFHDLKYPQTRLSESSAISVHTALSPHLFSPCVWFKERDTAVLEENDKIHKLRKNSWWMKSLCNYSPCDSSENVSNVFLVCPLKYRTPDIRDRSKNNQPFSTFWSSRDVTHVSIFLHETSVTSRHPSHWMKCAADETHPQPEIVELSASTYFSPSDLTLMIGLQTQSGWTPAGVIVRYI